MEMKEKRRCSILFQGHGGRRIVHDRDPQVFFIGQLLELFLPQAAFCPIGATRISGDEYLRLMRIELLAAGMPPPPHALYRELGGLMVDAQHSQTRS